MKVEILEGYDDYFDVDGTPLDFCIKRKTFHYKGIKVVLDKLPYLLNNTNGNVYFTTPAVVIINEYVDEAVEKGKKEVRINQFGRLNRGKLPVGDNTEFRYSPAEHFFIPGLIRDIPSNGFLTPVYFEKHVLVKFEHAEGYDISNYTESAGRIHGPEGIDVPYGINKDGYVIMWLGDIVDFPNKELLYLYSANVEPQYDIHSDFYRNQILGEWL
ncbi:hypothetical protein [Shewanella algae]|uniref:hypothetical protein n=1 Tax=Shewanella algae TaxID=38313 RepID=UPI001AACAA5C|nr:hypothetical protein [Shewanella algae]MBO2617254.1 hypothetical protein [Shewanella algae]